MHIVRVSHFLSLGSIEVHSMFTRQTTQWRIQIRQRQRPFPTGRSLNNPAR